MRVLIVDDEPLARARLRRLLQAHIDVQVLGEAGNALAAEAALTITEPDLIFLDIEMPGESGLAFAARLRLRAVPPAIIFTTAHPQHALDAYASSPIDYLLKPIEPARLAAALARASQPTRAQQVQEPKLSVQIGRQQRLIYAQDILAALSEDKYTRLIHTEGEAIIDLSLKELETQFGDRLLRIHRHALINRARLQGVISQAQGQHFADVLGLVQPLEISRRALPLVRAALAG
ncbi:MAG TPA: LytTR family DNA-binding domain-containing protein [Halothiobacillus sp.]|nr:LytTR family DNA-binding domain-containing protein [Halothiobacillus sp.]HQS28441.1 LytTR family DNA-binding domain-containing protein [Halothiobacillus sp.]